MIKSNAKALQWIPVITHEEPCIACGGMSEGNTCCPPDFASEEPTKPVPAETMAALVFATSH
jgi:hypothetical protein